MSRPHFRLCASAFALAVSACLPALSQAAAQTATSATAFPSTSVGSVSAAQNVTVTVSAAGAALAPTATPEFTVVRGGTCSAQQTYNIGDTCTVAVSFAPQAPGTSAGLVVLPSANGQPLGRVRVTGTALGSAAAFTPGSVTAFPIPSPAPHTFAALTTSFSGIVYLADRSSGQILRVDPVSSTTTVVASALSSTDPVTALAADVDGTLFLLRQSGAVVRVDATTGALTTLDLSNAPGSSSAAASAIAIDPQGRLLAAFGTTLGRLENGTWTTLAGNTACSDPAAPCGDGQTLAHAQFSSIRAITVDSAGNIVLADSTAARLRRVDVTSGIVSTVAGNGIACSHAPCGDDAPATAATLAAISGLATDALGNVYLAEAASGLRRIDTTTGAIHSLLPASETRFRSGTVALGTLRNGSVLLLSSADPSTVSQFTATAAALTFAQTTVGQTSTDSVQTVALTNLGNAPLTLAAPATGTNPSTTADFPLSETQTCPQVSSSSASQSLAPGATCSLQVKFKPTVAGNISSQVVLTQAAATAAVSAAAAPAAAPAAPTSYAISVQGIAAAPATAPASLVVVSLPTSPVYGQPVSLTASVYDPTRTGPTPTGTLTFTEGATTLASVTLSGGNASYTIMLPSTGSHTYSVSYSGDTYYAASTQNTDVSVTVAKAGSVFTPNIPFFQYMQNVGVAYVLSGQYSGTGIALPTGDVTYTLLDSHGTVVVTGISPHANRVNSIDEAAPLGYLHAGTYTLRLSYPGDTNFLALQQDYSVVVEPLPQQIVNFQAIPSPVTYGTPPIPLVATAITTGTQPSSQTGLPVVFTVLSGPGTVVNNQLVVTGVGTIVLAADQPGNNDYSAAPRVTQTIVSVRPVAQLVWNTPSPITVGTPLGPNQLNAVALDSNGQRLPGTYTYTPAAGTVPPAGPATLNVSYIPTDTDHYGTTPLTASVVLTVRDLNTPTITFAGGTVAFGTGLGTTLNAMATANGAAVAGTFVYTANGTTLTASTSLPVGTYSVLATFTPTDGNTYRGATATATITVTRSNTTIRFTGGTTAFGSTLGATLNATATANGASVPGTFVYTSNGATLSAGSALPAGTYTVLATFTPTDSNSYTGGSATATITVSRAAATVTIASSASPVLLNTSVTLVAHVTGGSPAPSGTVQFTSGSATLGSAAVDGTGTASFTLSTLPAGSQTITAVYSGDTNYAGASASLTEVVADFTLAIASGSSAKQSVLPGAVATYQFTVAPTVAATLVGNVTFKLSGLPSGTTYTLTPSTVASGSGATNVTLAITTPAQKSDARHSPLQRTSTVVAAALLLLPFSRRLRRGFLRTRSAGLLATVLFASAVLLSTTGCGAGVGYFDGSSLTTSTLTLTANSGSLTHSATVTLEVQ